MEVLSLQRVKSVKGSRNVNPAMHPVSALCKKLRSFSNTMLFQHILAYYPQARNLDFAKGREACTQDKKFFCSKNASTKWRAEQTGASKRITD